MAIALPNILPSTSSTVSPEYGIIQDMTDDGEMYSRDLYSSVRYVLNVVWDNESIADINTLENFVTTYRNVDVVVTLGNDVYTCKLVNGSVNKSYLGGLLGSLSVTYRGTKNA